MSYYNRLTIQEREDIKYGLLVGESIRSLALRMGRSPSTVYREVKRNCDDDGEYRPCLADQLARRRRGLYARRLDRNDALRLIAFSMLRARWSPEQISVWLKLNFTEDCDMRLSHESLYTYLYALPRGSLRKELLSYLRQHRKSRRPRSRGEDRRGQIPDMISIEERPAEVADRSVPGHWEGDLILGKHNRTSLGTLVERTTRTVILVPLESRDAESVRKAFARELKSLPRQMRLSLTYDQGKEMAEHRLFTKDTKMVVYFAHPASPWERGTNENTNGLIRQFFPKGTDFSEVSRYQIKKVQHLLNGRPRKATGFQTPYEAFKALLQ